MDPRIDRFHQLIKLLIRKNMYVGETFAVIDRIFRLPTCRIAALLSVSLYQTRRCDRCGVC